MVLSLVAGGGRVKGGGVGFGGVREEVGFAFVIQVHVEVRGLGAIDGYVDDFLTGFQDPLEFAEADVPRGGFEGAVLLLDDDDVHRAAEGMERTRDCVDASGDVGAQPPHCVHLPLPSFLPSSTPLSCRISYVCIMYVGMFFVV